MKTRRTAAMLVALFMLGTASVVAFEQHAYIQLYASPGGALDSRDLVDGEFMGFGIGVFPVNPTNDWVGRIGIDYAEGGASRERVRDDGFVWTDETTLRLFSATFDMLYGPGFAAKDTFRYYVGGGIGLVYEELEFHDEDLSNLAPQVSLYTGVQYGLFDAGVRLIALPGGENVYLMSRLSFGIALGPYDY